MGTLCGASLLLSSRIYTLNKAGPPLPSPKKTLSAAISVLMPRNGPATLYSLLTITFAGMAAMCLGASPGRPLVTYEGLSGPMTVFLHRVTGAGMLLQTLVAYSLKDGADREKLGATTFRCELDVWDLGIRRLYCVGTLMVYSLKDFSDREKLGATTFR